MTVTGGTTVHLYPKIVHGGGIGAAPPASEEIDLICQSVHEACKQGMGGDEKRGSVMKTLGRSTGWGVDKRVGETIGSTTAADRHRVSVRYRELYKETLRETFEHNLSGDFCDALRLLAESPPAAECRIIKKACDGLGTDEILLYSVLCGRSNADMETLKKTYFRLYEKDLGKLLIKELKGDLEKLMFTSLQATEERYDAKSIHTIDKALAYADHIFQCAQKSDWFGSGCDDRTGVYAMICSAPPPFLVQVDAAYREKYGHGIFYEIYRAKEVSPACKRAAIFTLGMKTKPAETVAKLIKTACAGLGTDETLLTACIVRYQPILKEVALAHLELYEKTLHERIRSETSGHYKAVLLAVLDKMFPEEDTSSGRQASLLGTNKIIPVPKINRRSIRRH